MTRVKDEPLSRTSSTASIISSGVDSPDTPATPRSPRMPRKDSADTLSADHDRMVQRVKTKGEWSGDLEIDAICKVYGLNVHVWERIVDNKFGHVSNFYENNTKRVDLNYDGAHYVPMTNVVGDGSRCTAVAGSAPADGDCLFHSVAEAAKFPYLAEILAAYRADDMGPIRANPFFMAWLDGPAPASDDELYKLLRESYVLQMRHDVGKELSKPEYAQWASIAGPALDRPVTTPCPPLPAAASIMQNSAAMVTPKKTVPVRMDQALLALGRAIQLLQMAGASAEDLETLKEMQGRLK